MIRYIFKIFFVAFILIFISNFKLQGSIDFDLEEFKIETNSIIYVLKKKGSQYEICLQVDKRLGTIARTDEYGNRALCYYGYPKKIYGSVDDKLEKKDGIIFFSNPNLSYDYFKRKHVPGNIQELSAIKLQKKFSKAFKSKEKININEFYNNFNKDISTSAIPSNNNFFSDLACGSTYCLAIYDKEIHVLSGRGYSPKSYGYAGKYEILEINDKDIYKLTNYHHYFDIIKDNNQKKVDEIKIVKVENQNKKKNQLTNISIDKVKEKIAKSTTSINSKDNVKSKLNNKTLSKKELREELEYWKGLLDDKLISQQDYEKQKEKLLKQSKTISNNKFANKEESNDEKEKKLEELVLLAKKRLAQQEQEYQLQLKIYEEQEERRRKKAAYNLMMQGLGLIANSGPQMNYNTNPFSPPKAPPIVDMTCKFGCIDLGFPRNNCTKMCSK